MSVKKRENLQSLVFIILIYEITLDVLETKFVNHLK